VTVAGRLWRAALAAAALALTASCGGGGRPILAPARVTYECPSCGKARTADVGAPAPECCGRTLRR
jgi:predicted RNA-binding Zn-ribbon protein involved in translation (DUF1610 family)